MRILEYPNFRKKETLLLFFSVFLSLTFISSYRLDKCTDVLYEQMEQNLMAADPEFTHLLGRRIKVNVCDAGAEFVAKLKESQRENSQHVANIPPMNELSVAEVIEKDEVLEESCVESDGICTSKSKSKEDAIPRFTSKRTVTDSVVDSIGSDQGYDTGVNESIELPVEIEPAEPAENSNLLRQEDKQNSDQTDLVAVLESSESDPPQVLVEDQDDDRDPMDVDTQSDASSNNDDEDDDSIPTSSPVSVSQKIKLKKYSESEWRGATHMAEQVRYGYTQVSVKTGCNHMRIIRGDNYCGLRATAFQILSQNLSVLSSWKKVEHIVSIPDTLLKKFNCNWLSQWSFAGRLTVAPRNKMDTMTRCLKTLSDQIKAAKSLTSDCERVKYFLDFFNSKDCEEVLLFEALKLLMLHAAVILNNGDQATAPEFSWLLFARDNSETPEQLMKTHLNTVGDAGGLEQVEMCLLGYALNVTIEVIRPSKVNQEDFITHYPTDHLDEWDKCNLIAEDDRHYNIIVP